MIHVSLSSLRKGNNLPMDAIYKEFLEQKNLDIFLIFAEAILTSSHNLCFGAKISQIGKPLHTPVFYIKVGFKGVYIARTSFSNESTFQMP